MLFLPSCDMTNTDVTPRLTCWSKKHHCFGGSVSICVWKSDRMRGWDRCTVAWYCVQRSRAECGGLGEDKEGQCAWQKAMEQSLTADSTGDSTQTPVGSSPFFVALCVCVRVCDFKHVWLLQCTVCWSGHCKLPLAEHSSFTSPCCPAKSGIGLEIGRTVWKSCFNLCNLSLGN